MFAEIRREYLDAENTALPFVLCTLGETTNQSPISRPQGFAQHHLIWVRQGEGLFWTKGEQRLLSPGMGLFCRRGVAHGYERAGASLDTRWVTFLGGEGALDYYSAPDSFFFQVDAALISATDRLDEACQGAARRFLAPLPVISIWRIGCGRNLKRRFLRRRGSGNIWRIIFLSL